MLPSSLPAGASWTTNMFARIVMTAVCVLVLASCSDDEAGTASSAEATIANGYQFLSRGSFVRP